MLDVDISLQNYDNRKWMILRLVPPAEGDKSCTPVMRS
jgi:hypothetical protein